jgi:hypothetical protein
MRRSAIYHLLISLVLLLGQQAMAQCPFGGTLLTNINPTGAGFTVSNPIRGGYYVTVAVCAGATYTFSTCGDLDFDTQITVFDETTTGFIAYNDDGCGAQSTITWLANFTGTLRVLVNRFSCLNSNAALLTTLTVTQTTDCGTAIFPPNDGCAGALPIVCGQTIAGSTTDATPEAIVAGCGNATSASEWYVFTGTGQNITASLCGSAYDSQISVLTGTCGGTLTCVAYNDDFCGLQSQVTFTSVNGTQYYIRVSGIGTASGNYSLSLTCASPPVNDGCAGALPIACGQTIAGSTTDATPEAIVAGCGNNTSPSEWYTFTGSGQSITASLCGSAYDSQISVLTGTCAGTLTCVAYNDDFCGLQSQVTFASVNGTQYYIRVSGIGTASGNYSLSLTCASPVANDGCAGALPIACGQTIAGSTTDATPEAIVVGCGNASSASEWYVFTGNGQNISASLCGSAYDTQISVLTGTCAGALTCVAFNDDFCGLQSQVNFTSVTGTQYYIRVSGFGSGAGNYTLALTCTVPLLNDGCAGALPIACGQTITGSTVGAIPEVIAAGCGNASSPSIWYAFTGTGELTTMSLCGSAYDTQLAVVSGDCSGAQICVAFNDDFCGTQSQVTFSSVLGVVYYIRVGGFGNQSGTFTLAVSCVTEMGNDPCTGALPIDCGQTVTGNTTGMNPDAFPAGCGLAGFAGAWYTFVGDGSVVDLSTCAGTAFDTQISVFNGDCAGLNCIGTNDQFCGDQSQVTFLSAAGSTYYVLVHGLADAGSYSLSMTCNPYTPSAQECQGANTVCNDQQFNGNSLGFGFNQELNTANSGCLFEENQSSWYVFSPITTGTIAFTINPTPIVDYDFAIWGPFVSAPCPPVGDPVRCSFSALNAATGLGNGATDSTEGAGGDAWVAPITVTAAEINQFYVMVLDNFTSSSTPFVFDWALSGGLTLDCTIQLPVTYLEWAGAAKGAYNQLWWSTATESMNELFVVERSVDNLHFEQVGSLAGHGTTLAVQHYEWLDRKPLPGTNYYRLRQVDWNGQSNYSDVIAIERSSYFALVPNPAEDVVKIMWTSDGMVDSQIELNDLCGRTIVRLERNALDPSTAMELSVARLSPGTYVVTMRSKQGIVMQQGRLIVQ